MYLKVGDLVKHQYGTLQGTGVILKLRAMATQAQVLWTSHGRTQVHEAVATKYLEVIK